MWEIDTNFYKDKFEILSEHILYLFFKYKFVRTQKELEITNQELKTIIKNLKKRVIEKLN